MDASRRGLNTVAKVGVIFVAFIVLVAALYVAGPFSKGAASQSSTQTTGSIAGNAPGSVTNLGSNQTFAVVSLFPTFSQMRMTLNFYDPAEGNSQNSTYAYTVLGSATLGGVQYTKVDFRTLGVPDAAGNEVIVWFTSAGAIGRVDVIGERNYTGSGAAVLAQSFTGSFGLLPLITSNSTLLAMLSKTSTSTLSIGPTQANVETYTLASPTPTYTSITVEYATFSGTSAKLAVFLDETTADGATTTIQVTSLTR